MDEDLLKRVIGSVLDVAPATIDDDTNADNVDDWSSIVQLSLILALEEEFDIEIPDVEAPNMTSYPLIRLVVSEQMGQQAPDG
jgi:acyl carrier protein